MERPRFRGRSRFLGVKSSSIRLELLYWNFFTCVGEGRNFWVEGFTYWGWELGSQVRLFSIMTQKVPFTLQKNLLNLPVFKVSRSPSSFDPFTNREVRDIELFKIITSLPGEELAIIKTRTKSLADHFHWDRISFPLNRFHSFPYGSYLAYINTLDQESTLAEKDIEFIRDTNLTFPVLLVVDVSCLEQATKLLTGPWDALIPKVCGWEQRLEIELQKVAELQSREQNYLEGGCLLSVEMSMKEYNQRILEHYLAKYHGSVYEVARRLDMGKSTIYRMLKEKAAVE